MDKQHIFDDFVGFYQLWCPGLDRKVASFFAAQSALETGWFESEVFCKCNNLFGMRLPKFRITIADGSKLKHAYYRSIIHSFVDYLLWLSYYGFIQSDFKDLDRFVRKFRSCPFNPSKTYVDTILKIYKTYYHD